MRRDSGFGLAVGLDGVSISGFARAPPPAGPPPGSAGDAALQALPALAAPLENGMVDRYRYDEGRHPDQVAEDLRLLEGEWKERLKKSIQAEATLTNNWSLLWKAEGIYESLDNRIRQKLLDTFATRAGRTSFRAQIKAVCDPAVDAQCAEFQTEMFAAPALAGTASSPPGIPAAATAVGIAPATELFELWKRRREAQTQADKMFGELSAWTKCEGRIRIPDRRPAIRGFDHLSARLVEWITWPYLSAGVFQVQPNMLVYGPAGAGKTLICQLAAYDIARSLQWARARQADPAARPGAPAPSAASQSGSSGSSGAPAARPGEAPATAARRLSEELNSLVTVYFVDALRFRSPDPRVVGARLRNHLNCLQYEVTRDRKRQQTRSKLGVLILDNLDALFLTDRELEQEPRPERRASQFRSWTYRAAPEVLNRYGGRALAAPDLPAARAAGSDAAADPAALSPAARDMASARSGEPRGAGAGEVLLFAPPARPAQRFLTATPTVVTTTVTASPAAVAAAGPLSGAPPAGLGVVGSSAGGEPLDVVLASVLGPAALEAEYPDVRVIWTARYIWRFPPSLRRLVAGRQLFVDLPGARARRSHLEELLREDLYANVAGRLIEEDALRRAALAAPDAKDQRTEAQLAEDFDGGRTGNEPDQALYVKERELADAVKDVFLRSYRQYQSLPIRPAPRLLLSSIVHAPPNYKYRALADAFLAASAPALDLLTGVSGMSLEGYCQLQSKFFLTFDEVDSFLVIGGKKSDGFSGNTPYGYTLEDLRGLFKQLRTTVNTRLVRQGFEVRRAFIYGSSRLASSFCRQTAADIEQRRAADPLAVPATDDPGSAGENPAASWLPVDAEQGQCLVAVGPDLADVRTGRPVLPMWARFGSHRALAQTDAYRAINDFEKYVTPKADYPQFVLFEMYGRPTPIRSALPAGQQSQLCGVRPGPASTFLFPTAQAVRLAAPPRALLARAVPPFALGPAAPLFLPPPPPFWARGQVLTPRPALLAYPPPPYGFVGGGAAPPGPGQPPPAPGRSWGLLARAGGRSGDEASREDAARPDPAAPPHTSHFARAPSAGSGVTGAPDAAADARALGGAGRGRRRREPRTEPFADEHRLWRDYQAAAANPARLPFDAIFKSHLSD
jgi:hypothetical protein